MARKYYSIFILPHAQARFRKIHVSRNFVLVLGLVLGLVAAAGVVAPHLWFRVQAQEAALTRLQAENDGLRADKERFESSLSELGGEIDSMEQRAVRLARSVGLADLTTDHHAGGASDGTSERHGVQWLLDEELGALRGRAAVLNASFDRLDEAWTERVKLLGSTPSRLPVQGFFSDGYGWRRDPFTGAKEFHKGIDIVAPTGTIVVATADGIVTRAGRMAGYGKLVHLSHGYGFATRYGHLNEILVEAGQRVRRGDPIGRVGSTGRSTGPHLHYEVTKSGRRVNPRKYIGDPPV